ncbi:unnamed protein product, partial [Effrenium voratum]
AARGGAPLKLPLQTIGAAGLASAVAELVSNDCHVDDHEPGESRKRSRQETSDEEDAAESDADTDSEASRGSMLQAYCALVFSNAPAYVATFNIAQFIDDSWL